jgi:hypothetical protein
MSFSHFPMFSNVFWSLVLCDNSLWQFSVTILCDNSLWQKHLAFWLFFLQILTPPSYNQGHFHIFQCFPMFFDPFRCTQIHPDPFRSSQIQPDPPRSTQIQPDPSRSTQIYSDPPRSTQIHSDPPRSTQIHPDPPRSTEIHPDSSTSTQIHPTQIHLDPPYVWSWARVPLVITMGIEWWEKREEGRTRDRREKAEDNIGRLKHMCRTHTSHVCTIPTHPGGRYTNIWSPRLC